MATDEPVEQFMVLMNDEEQYSLWQAALPIPKGWRQVGPSGSREECLKYVDENWTDMRPASLRAAMAARQNGNA